MKQLLFVNILLFFFILSAPIQAEDKCEYLAKCEVKKTDHRCDTHGACKPQKGSTCYQWFVCDSDRKWVSEKNCHGKPTYDACPEGTE